MRRITLVAAICVVAGTTMIIAGWELRCARTESGDRDRRGGGSGSNTDLAVRDHGQARQKPSLGSMGCVLKFARLRENCDG